MAFGKGHFPHQDSLSCLSPGSHGVAPASADPLPLAGCGGRAGRGDETGQPLQLQSEGSACSCSRPCPWEGSGRANQLLWSVLGAQGSGWLSAASPCPISVPVRAGAGSCGALAPHGCRRETFPFPVSLVQFSAGQVWEVPFWVGAHHQLGRTEKRKRRRPGKPGSFPRTPFAQAHPPPRLLPAPCRPRKGEPGGAQ